MAVLYRATSTVQKESVSLLMKKLGNRTCPFLSLFMTPKPSGTRKDPNVKDTTHKWENETLKGTRDKLDVALAAAATTMYTTNKNINYADGVTYVQIDDERILVGAASYATGTGLWTLSSLTRGAFGTTDAEHKAGTQVELQNVFAEGNTISNWETDLGVFDYNYTQIFQVAINITGTMQAIETYNDENKLETQLQDKIPNLFQQLENGMKSSIRYLSGNTRIMGGMPYFVTAAMTEDSQGNKFSMKTLAQDYEKLIFEGVDPTNIMLACGTKVKASINDLKASIVEEKMTIDKIDYNIERLSVAGGHDVTIPPYTPIIGANEYYLFDKDSIKIKFLRPYEVHELAKTTDGDGKFAVMECTAEFHSWANNGALRRKNVG